MAEKELMNKAIETALNSEESFKCACVIVKDGEIIASAYNSQRRYKNATAHDGIKAVALAGRSLGQKDLPGCIVFCTHEPCAMCLSAMIFAKIEAVYFAIPLSETSKSDKRINISAEELAAKAPRPLRIVPRFMEAEVIELLEDPRGES